VSPEFNLAGKDYFTQAEAAHYCGLSVRQFQLVATGYGIRCGRFGGKLLYRRVDLQEAIEREWRRLEPSMGHGCSTGETRTAGGTGTRSGASASSPRRKPAASSNSETPNSQPATVS
jgi:hypothetical protein